MSPNTFEASNNDLDEGESFYAGSIGAYRELFVASSNGSVNNRSSYRHSVHVTKAFNQQQAIEIFTDIGYQLFPSNQGWDKPTVAIMEIKIL